MQFSDHKDSNRKMIEEYGALAQIVSGMKAIGRKTVVTIGSWDLLHIGHVRYLMRARSFGDALIVGVDTDKTIRYYKGALRPIVPYTERAEMLTYQSCVDLVTPVHDVDDDGKWQYGLVRELEPDVFVAVEDSYPQEQLDEIEKHCEKLIVLPRQAENTSTTNLVQNTVKKHLDQMYSLLEKR
jgi:D-glycero-beta-D-manno-heptose 1-phosphate adenylyltransferase